MSRRSWCVVPRPARARARSGVATLALLCLLLPPAPASAQLIPGPVTGRDGVPATPRPTFDDRPEIEEPTEDTLRTSTAQVTSLISARINRALVLAPARGRGDDDEEEVTGQSRADGEADGWGGGFLAGGALAAWGNAGLTWLDYDGRGAEYDGTIVLPLAGADYAIPRGMVFGVSLGYERIDLDTAYNRGTLEADGVSVTPYLGARIGENLVVDGGVGYTRLSYDRVRRDGGLTRTGSFDADRVFTFANLAAYAPQEWIGVEELVTIGRVGFRYSHEDQDGFRESTGGFIRGGTIELGQVSIGAEMRYYPEVAFAEELELFASVTGTIDAIRTDRDDVSGFAAGSDDRTGVTLGFGAVAAITERVSLDLSYEQVLSREDLTELTVTAGVRVNF